MNDRLNGKDVEDFDNNFHKKKQTKIKKTKPKLQKIQQKERIVQTKNAKN